MLATFTVEQRIKEIGVRKVLGASVASIVTLLLQDFLKLVIMVIVVAIPLAWYAMNAWLKNFEYKITMSVEVFVLAIAGTFLIAMLTIGYRAISAALMNPVTSLRSEWKIL